MGYIQIYDKIPAKRANKVLQEVEQRGKRIIEQNKGFSLDSTMDAYKVSRVTL